MMRLRAAWRDARAVSIVEFALVLPVLLVVMMGFGELAFEYYVQVAFTGAMQKAARDSTIQGNSTDAKTAAIDQAVKSVMGNIVPTATYTSARENYDSYASIAGEPFTDSRYPADGTGTYDGTCDHGEPYVDVNGNGKYDLNLGSTGQGGADDVTKFTLTVTYARLFPLLSIGWNKMVTLSSTTILKNQPYATQSTDTGTKTGSCK